MASAEHVLKFTAELDNAIVVRPGDKLVIAFSRRLDMQQVDHVKQRCQAMLPGVEFVIFDEITAMAVYRPDDEVATPGARDAAARKAARISGERP